MIMANNIVITYSDILFDLYNRADDPSKKGSQNGWPYCETERGLRIFQEAAEPHISGKPQHASSATPPSPLPRQQTRPIWLQTFWPVLVGALVVICCVLALAWQADRQVLASARFQHQDTEVAKVWREAEQQLMQSLLAEVGSLNTNQAALSANQAQIGVGLAKLSIIDTQLAGLVSTQADASRGLAAAQTALAQQVTNLAASLPQTFQQGLAEAASQSRADTLKLQTQVEELESPLRQTFHRELAEAVGKSRADTEKLQTQVTEVAASHKALLDRLSGPTNAPNLGFALPGSE
jgi:hypothetical protein